MAATLIRSKAVSLFKLHGLSLRSEATKILVDVLVDVDKQDIDRWLDRVIEVVLKQPLTDSFISKDLIEVAISECQQGGSEEGDQVFNIIDAFSIPRFRYDKERKKFMKIENQKAFLHGTSEVKTEMFTERYAIIHQRALHHELFTPETVAASASTKGTKFALKPVEHLLGCSGSLDNVIVLGMLTQLKEGKYYLEDPSGAVALDLSQTVFHTGLFTENCFVLAEGSFEDDIFRVTALGFPPPEPAKVTRSFFGNMNFFGGPSPICVANSDKFKKLEQENPDAMFVFLSEVWLDQPKVMTKLRTLFSGYADIPPAVFVICGNFLSQPYGSKCLTVLRDCFNELAEMICSFQSLLENSRFVFVPGPQDPGLGNILPRPPICKLLVEVVKEKVPFAEFTSNPCRIQYCSQEIVIFREDIINRMCRNCVHLPSDLENIPSHFAKTIVSQAHLAPLPTHIRPTYWSFDHSLRLYPLPDLIVCADKYGPYNVLTAETICMNPGSFSRSDFSFKVYWPASREVEDCKISE